MTAPVRPPIVPPPVVSSAVADDTAALARGGRTSFVGFVLRLAARLPFLFIAGQFYGAENLGRFAYATMVVELMAQLSTLGLKRGLAAALANTDRPQAEVVGDALVLAWALALLGAGFLALFPELIFPKDVVVSGLDQLIPLTALATVGSDVSLAALAYRGNVRATVTARSLVEPWVLTLVALALAFTHYKRDGLIIAYAVSLTAAFGFSIVPCIRAYGWPRGWRPHPERLATLARANVPLAGADAIEWGTRRLDLFILGLFAGPATIGIYYVAQQVATLPQKLKTSFDPVLGPVLSRALVDDDRAAIATHVRQVSFWIIAAQLGVGLALGLTGGAVLETVGEGFAIGALALAILLAAEVVAATGTVSESALVYIAPKRNLWLSLLVIGAQAAVTLALAPMFGMIGAAAGVFLALGFGSVLKARFLARELGAAVVGWRRALLLAAAGGLVVGSLIIGLPDLWKLVVGIPGILIVYFGLLWFRGFQPADRVLFARRAKA